MESLPDTPILKFHPNTLQNVRKIYGLETVVMVNESIDRLHEWIQKQNYFNKKDYSREYLERLIIGTKGSVERAKERLEKICTLRTLAPSYFGLYRSNELTGLEFCIESVLPTVTKNYYRVYIVKGYNVTFNQDFLQNYCKRLVLGFEYLMKYDYSKGAVAIIDSRESSFFDFLQLITVTETRNHLHMFFECYVARLQAMHMIVNSKFPIKLFHILKSLFTPKINQRFQLHDSLDSLHQAIEKDILPVEYGGKEKPLLELHKKFIEVLSTDEFMETVKEMRNATIDSNLKSLEDFGDRYNLGLAGTFRKLNVD